MVLKLARGHALFDLNEPHTEEPSSIAFLPLMSMTEDDRLDFESEPSSRTLSVWAEVGSRAMQRQAESWPEGTEWLTVQRGRYRYLASADGRVIIRMVLSEYLACEVVWDN